MLKVVQLRIGKFRFEKFQIQVCITENFLIDIKKRKISECNLNTSTLSQSNIKKCTISFFFLLLNLKMSYVGIILN